MTRFDADGAFDPPLEPSTQAGAGGVVGDEPTVASEHYGAVYVAWQENRNGPDTDILFARAERAVGSTLSRTSPRTC